MIGNANANIQEVVHQRAFTNLPLQTTEVDFVLRTRDLAHVDEVIAALAAAGFTARRLGAEVSAVRSANTASASGCSR